MTPGRDADGGVEGTMILARGYRAYTLMTLMKRKAEKRMKKTFAEPLDKLGINPVEANSVR